MLTRWLIAGAVLLGLMAPAQAGAILDRVKAANALDCSVLVVPEDYTKGDIHGSLDALGGDLCRAVAAAVLGTDGKVILHAYSDERHGFEALQAGKVDLLFGTSPAASAEIAHGLRFGRPVFYDAEGLLVHRDSGIGSFADLAGKSVCFIGSTHGEDVLDSEAARRGIKVLPFPFEEDGEMDVALLRRHCAAIISSVSRLANTRAGFHGQVDDYVILPDRLSVEPVAPAMRDGDPQWAAVVDATMDALLMAEAAGVKKADAALLRTTEDPLLRTLGGLVPGIDEKVVDRNWAVRAVAAVGNYGEVYDRDVGSGSDLDLPRGMNALWSKGGLMVSHAPR